MNEKEIVHPDFLTYALEHSKELSPLHIKIQRETYIEERSPIMISTPLQGQLLYFLTKMIRPKTILEIGTFTGYSAICMAQALDDDAKVITLEFNKELGPKIEKYIAEAGLTEKIELIIGAGLESLKHLDGPFDMVFIDADKPNYSNYYEAVLSKVSTGGYILTDNVLWQGKVFSEDRDESTAAIRSYNQRLKEDDRVEQIILPIGDGLSIARKLV